ncbi:MAG: hypothetical protein HQL54_14390 [Magnetococcales bacterium]|nr:hypothetical protein [Magnetococcales bacterium]
MITIRIPKAEIEKAAKQRRARQKSASEINATTKLRKHISHVRREQNGDACVILSNTIKSHRPIKRITQSAGKLSSFKNSLSNLINISQQVDYKSFIPTRNAATAILRDVQHMQQDYDIALRKVTKNG